MYDDEMEDSGILPPPVEGTKSDVMLKDKDVLISNINAILKKDQNTETENELINLVQKQRTLLLDIATQTYISKPSNCKLLDSINTLIGQLEKSVRDDRKEKAKAKEMEDNKTSFAAFVNALNEVANGKLVIPNYGDMGIILDPLKPVTQLYSETMIKAEELAQGLIVVDSKEIEESFDE
ncbi:hypothetical protein PS1_0220 [Aeromonas phage PS1]|uniref:Uncharacterized protein n=1 Tax=Aeromonas phage PS1 TaxID=2591406 RepID=A0A514TUN4_9CAUD|nr:hypothetical protein PQC64_gp043 [Aeromonas phage PS1]QDJ96731.1 hypothetical protein PS1_0220 [Aeromonas phage PS1]